MLNSVGGGSATLAQDFATPAPNGPLNAARAASLSVSPASSSPTNNANLPFSAPLSSDALSPAQKSQVDAWAGKVSLPSSEAESMATAMMQWRPGKKQEIGQKINDVTDLLKKNGIKAGEGGFTKERIVELVNLADVLDGKDPRSPKDAAAIADGVIKNFDDDGKEAEHGEGQSEFASLKQDALGALSSLRHPVNALESGNPVPMAVDATVIAAGGVVVAASLPVDAAVAVVGGAVAGIAGLFSLA